MATFGLVIAGCGGESNLLAVEVQTDLVAGVEFGSVRSTLSSGQVERRSVTLADDFGSSRRVAGFSGISAGAVELRVELLDPNDVAVLTRDVELDIQGTTAARVALSRSCMGMDCGPSQTCTGGRCVSRRCSPLDPNACGEPECGRDDNCDAPIPCSVGICADGACLAIGRSDRCELGRYCDPSAGCRLAAPLPDGGTLPDASIPDAAVADPCPGMGRNIYVNAEFGDDLLTGLTPFEPFATVDRALIGALDGDCINLSPGVYRDDASTRRGGTAERPITVRGPSDAIVHGASGGSTFVMRVRHDHIHLEGFTLDGLDGDPSMPASYHRVLLEVRSEEPNEGVDGFVARNLTLRNALRHCVAFRYFTVGAEWDSVTIDGCGLDEALFSGTPSGQGIIIGTSPSSLDTNPTRDPDASVRNHIHDSTFRNLNVCVVTREASNETLVENNSCTGQRNATTGGFDFRSDANTVRGNEIFENDGSGIRLGGATATDGINNTIRENIIRDNAVGGIRFQVQPQGVVCGNTMSGNLGGDATGVFATMFDPTAPCP